VSFYIDGEVTPSISVTLLELAWVGRQGALGNQPPTDNHGAPWGVNLFGHTAKSGGVSSTLRIPFGTHLRVTIRAPASAKAQSVYWMIVRGVEQYPVVLGDLQLPASARLKTYRIQDKVMAHLEFIHLANISADTSGECNGGVRLRPPLLPSIRDPSFSPPSPPRPWGLMLHLDGTKTNAEKRLHNPAHTRPLLLALCCSPLLLALGCSPLAARPWLLALGCSPWLHFVRGMKLAPFETLHAPVLCNPFMPPRFVTLLPLPTSLHSHQMSLAHAYMLMGGLDG